MVSATFNLNTLLKVQYEAVVCLQKGKKKFIYIYIYSNTTYTNYFTTFL